ncbi:protein kinase [Streptosporangium sp. NPDC050855]|uniref:serine/threonine-protein kinase n=1 Tax=Streptosporangium sp. NPDC050855 TaxID=3366194 RepID=UPI0037A81833
MVPEYREIRELGAGGGGRVVLATYAPTGAYVAIKYLDAALKDDPGFLARLRAEARVLVELRDPNVVGLHEYYEDVLEAAVVMELVDGVALRRILDEHGTTSPEAALAVLRGSLLGLAAAHDAGVLHRDLRPENVLVQADGGSKLADLGIALPSGHPGGFAYLAPERRQGAPASAAADVHAAACVFYECLTGRRPPETGPGVAPAHRGATPVPVDEVPSSVRGLITRGMAVDPADRPRSAREFLQEVEAAAPAAYGPEWEQRGRRHLAEAATLLALTFPLARPAEAGPAGRGGVFGRGGRAGRAGRADRIRRPRLGPRTLAVLGVITVAMTAGVIAGNRPQDRLSADTIFTPPPDSAVVEETPVRRRTRATAPAGPGEPRPSRSTVDDRIPSPSRATPADRAAPLPVVPPTPPALPERPRTTAPVPTGSRTPSARPPDPTPRVTPGPTGSPTGTRRPPAPAHTVGDLSIPRIDAHGAVIRLRASTTGDVTLTVTFAEGPDPGRLVEAPPRTVVLGGSTSYSHALPYAFADPACGHTVHRRVTVSTVPGAPGGAFGRTEEVRGEPCEPPAVSITSFDGTTVAFQVTTSGPAPVTVRLGFAQGPGGAHGTPPSDTRELKLSGDTEYAREVTGKFGEPQGCDGHATRLVTITTLPVGAVSSRTALVDLPPCSPDPDPDPDSAPDSGPDADAGSPGPGTPPERPAPEAAPGPSGPGPFGSGPSGFGPFGSDAGPGRADVPEPAADEPGPRGAGRSGIS